MGRSCTGAEGSGCAEGGAQTAVPARNRAVREPRGRGVEARQPRTWQLAPCCAIRRLTVPEDATAGSAVMAASR